MNWIEHFRNRPGVELDRFRDEQISAVERERVGRSIALFQRGESSEAKDYLAKSARFAEELGEPAFLTEAQLFVQEENFHSALLGNFMRQMQIAPATKAWSDHVFRWLRSPGDIGWSSRVLLTAEILAQVYYPALREATNSEMLRVICERVIEDEDYHILFQTERIARVMQRRHPLTRFLHAAIGFFLFWGTVLVVWPEHHAVLSRSLSFSQYIKNCFSRFQFARQQLKGRPAEIIPVYE